jgi:hypothetical protein
VRFHAEAPLIALLGLRYLGIALITFVLSRAGRLDQRGIDDCTTFMVSPF